MASRKNKWRRRGRFEFRRETKRFSDGSPWVPATDILYIRIHRVGCAVVEPNQSLPSKVTRDSSLWVLHDIYRATSPIPAAHSIRKYLLNKLENRNER